jgi:nucleotide-binding universal stress UspA family protein
MRRIVVGYDGDEASTRALDHAIADARDSGGRLVVVAVSEMPLNPEGPAHYGTLDDSPPSMLPITEPPELEPIFVSARDRIEAAGVKADYVWGAGEPGHSIVDAARDAKADVVVLGSHHHGLFSRMLGSDVASEVKRAVDCDVVVVD